MERLFEIAVNIGPGYVGDSGVILGYLPSRSIGNYRLEIGSNAHIRSGTVIYAGTSIGDNLSTGHNVIIREENKIGHHFSVAGNSVIDYGCVIGNQVKVHSNVYMAQFTIVEDEVFLAPGVSIANDPHPGCPFSSNCMRGPTIKRGAQIGVNVTILPFVTIGEGALIGAGSVVTHNIAPFSVAFGNPARVVRSVYDLSCVVSPPLTGRPYQPTKEKDHSL